MLLAGAIAAAAIFYANSLVEFPTLHASLAAVVVAVMVVRGLFGWQRRRLADQLFRQLPDTIEMVTSAVRSGLPVNEAFRAVSREMPQPTAGQFAILCSELALGRPPEEAMEGVYQRTQVPEYGFFAVTLGVQLKSGGGLAETLQTLGDTVRQRVALAARAKALAGEVIFSARALSVAPLIVGGLLYLISPVTVDLLFTDPTGRKLLAYAAASVLLGISGDPLDGEKEYSPMIPGLGLAALAIAAAAAAFVLIIHELHIRALNMRVSKAVIGVPGQSAPLQDVTFWLSSLGMRYRRFYSAEDLDELRMIVQSSGFNPHRTLPIWIGVKIVSMALFPLVAFFVAEFFGKPPMGLLIFTLIGVVIGIMGPRLILSVLKRRFAAAVRRGTPDAIDLLVVCSEAGMGLESGLERVAEEMNRSNSAMARVLSGLLDDLRMLPNRRDAFEKLGSTSDGLRRVRRHDEPEPAIRHAVEPGSALYRRRTPAGLDHQARRKGAQVGRQTDDSDGVVHASRHVRHFGRESVSAPHACVSAMSARAMSAGRAISTDSLSNTWSYDRWMRLFGGLWFLLLALFVTAKIGASSANPWLSRLSSFSFAVVVLHKSKSAAFFTEKTCFGAPSLNIPVTKYRAGD